MPSIDDSVTEILAGHRRLICAVIVQSIKDAATDPTASEWLESEVCAGWLDALELLDAFRRRGLPSAIGHRLWRQTVIAHRNQPNAAGRA